jgi:MFS family permease
MRAGGIPAEAALNTPITTLTPTIERSNYNHLVMDVAWFGLALAATSRFLSIYAIRLGATPIDLGWLTALPFIVLLGSNMLSTRWRQHFPDSINALFWPALGMRMMFLLPALTPLFPPHLQPAWLIMSATLPALPQGISSTLFAVMMREAVPENVITRLLSQRSLLLNIVLGLTALIFGLWLEKGPFPVNYQVMFLIAFVAALLSQIHVLRIRVKPVPVVAARHMVSAQPLRRPSFQRTAVIALVIHLGFFTLIPVTPLHLVRTLNASEGFVALFGTAELAAAALICMFTDRITRRIGSRAMVGIAMLGTAGAALILAGAHSLPITLVAAALSGAAWTAATIGLFGVFTDSTSDVPMSEMTDYTIIYHQVIYAAAFVGPLIGSNLANTGVSLVFVMLVGALLRLGAGGAVLKLDTLWTLTAQRSRRAYHRRSL